MARARTARSAAAARRNGSRGGRPRKVKQTEEQVAAAVAALALKRFEQERAANIQFLVDMRDGLVPGCSAMDRVRAVENMLDRDAGTARTTKDNAPPPDAAQPKLVELAPGTLYAPPDGWEGETRADTRPSQPEAATPDPPRPQDVP